MKQLRLLLCLLLMSILADSPIHAQNYFVRRSSRKIDASAEVRDSSGAAVPYDTWFGKLMAGTHGLQPIDSAANIYRLVTAAKLPAPSLLVPPNPGSHSLLKGRKAKLFRVKDIDGNLLDLRRPDGTVTVLNFWFINCPPCRREIPELNALADRFKDNPRVRFVAVALDSKYDLKEFLKTQPFHYRIVDNGLFYSREYKINAYPTHVVVDGEGVVQFSAVGYGRNTVQWLQRSVEGLLGE